MEAWKIYRSLSAEQKAILSSKRLEVNRPVDDILALVRPLAACDAIGNKAQTRFGCTFGLAIVASVVLAIVFSNVGWSPVTWAAIAAVIAVAAGSGWFYFWLRSIDVSNNLRSFVVPVLALFREDFDRRHPLHLRIDLDSPTAKKKKTGESAPYSRGVYHKIIESTYVDPWMSADAVLADGTKLSWSVTDRIRERQKTKRNPRGKYKTKTKHSKKTDLEVTVALRAKTFALAGAEVSKDGKRNKVEVRRTVRTASLDPIDPRELVDAIAGVYRSARPVKKEARA